MFYDLLFYGVDMNAYFSLLPISVLYVRYELNPGLFFFLFAFSSLRYTRKGIHSIHRKFSLLSMLFIVDKERESQSEPIFFCYHKVDGYIGKEFKLNGFVLYYTVLCFILFIFVMTINFFLFITKQEKP